MHNKATLNYFQNYSCFHFDFIQSTDQSIKAKHCLQFLYESEAMGRNKTRSMHI